MGGALKAEPQRRGTAFPKRLPVSPEPSANLTNSGAFSPMSLQLIAGKWLSSHLLASTDATPKTRSVTIGDSEKEKKKKSMTYPLGIEYPSGEVARMEMV